MPEEITSEILQVIQDTARHLRPCHSYKPNRCHTQPLRVSNVSHKASDSRNSAHPEVAFKVDFVICAFLKTHKRGWKMKATHFTNVATSYQVSSDSRNYFIYSKKTAEPVLSVGRGRGIRNYQTYQTIHSCTTSEQQTCDTATNIYAGQQDTPSDFNE